MIIDTTFSCGDKVQPKQTTTCKYIPIEETFLTVNFIQVRIKDNKIYWESYGFEEFPCLLPLQDIEKFSDEEK